MYISVPTTRLRQVAEILRDHNVHPVEAHLPVIGGTQLINIRDDQIAKDVIFRLKSVGAFTAVTSTA